jgi:hypothetical protein
MYIHLFCAQRSFATTGLFDRVGRPKDHKIYEIYEPNSHKIHQKALKITNIMPMFYICLLSETQQATD